MSPLAPRRSEDDPFLVKALGPLEAALASALRLVGADVLPYAVEVDKHIPRGIVASIRFEIEGRQVRHRLRVVAYDPNGSD